VEGGAAVPEALVNTAVISTVVAAFLGIIGTLLGWWVRRTDRAAHLTQHNLDTMAENLTLVDAIKHDFWDLESWAQDVKLIFRSLQRELKDHGVLTEIHDLPQLPESRVRKIERKREDDKRKTRNDEP
jgi:hypothetical protein